VLDEGVGSISFPSPGIAGEAYKDFKSDFFNEFCGGSLCHARAERSFRKSVPGIPGGSEGIPGTPGSSRRLPWTPGGSQGLPGRHLRISGEFF
jgi:hypothetical protein